MIGRMIDSVKGCDEIMVVDTGSTDDTVKIAKEKGAKVFRGYKWNDNFSEARNVAKDKCKSEWLLIIDCDEVFVGDIDRLREFLASDVMKDMDAAMFDVDTGSEVNDQIRVFRNSDDIEWAGAVHNLPYRITDNGHERIQDDRIFKSSFKIRAYHSPSHKLDPDRSLRILDKELRKDPNNTRYMYYIAREWLNRKQVLNAIFYLERYIKVAPETNEKADTYYILATCYLDTGDVHTAINNALQAIRLLPSLRAAWAMLHNVSHKNYKKYWLPSVHTADNKGALFVRDGEEKLI